ncbi:hypothetical protein ACAG39_08625 [Caldicellulosiruptoraceae bacterium PP1]
MDTTAIIIVFGVIFCVGGPIIGHYASKASEKAEKEEMNKPKSK